MTILERTNILETLDNTLKKEFNEKISKFKTKLEEELRAKEEELAQPKPKKRK